MNNKSMKLKVALLLCLSSSLSYSQIIINSDILNAGGEFSVVTLKSGALAPTTAVVDFFWFSSNDVTTISGWNSASDWTSSALYSNQLGNGLTMGDGYSSAGLFSGAVNGGIVEASTVGKFIGVAITSGSELGVFRGSELVPDNTPTPSPPSAVAFLLPDVNSDGVMVGSFSVLSTVELFGSTFENVEAYALIPEPSSASLLALGVAGLVALRVRRKS